MKGRKVGELMEDLEALASRLASSPDYRVLRRLDPAYAGGPKIRGDSVRRAAIVDVETTGLDSTPTASCTKLPSMRILPTWSICPPASLTHSIAHTAPTCA